MMGSLLVYNLNSKYHDENMIINVCCCIRIGLFYSFFLIFIYLIVHKIRCRPNEAQKISLSMIFLRRRSHYRASSDYS